MSASPIRVSGGVDPLRRIRRLEPLRTPSWTPPLPAKPREQAPAEPEKPEEDPPLHVSIEV
ncbi:MAG: hypothetical protein JNK04_18025 [Myxococcales bacterium]|nr:hypothetical protein [Myxococcales bacterium]